MSNQPPPHPVPSVADTLRIAAESDPLVRNLQITQCYYELSAAFCARTGQNANWCTFATWASKQAGQTIRKEDLKRAIEEILKTSPEPVLAAGDVTLQTQTLASGRAPQEIYPTVWQSLEITRAIDHTSQAVGRGNQKVFAEIGYEFARFYESCFFDPAPDPARIEAFCQALAPGPPPEGQDYLRAAFTHYYEALFEPNPQKQAELMLLANLLVGFHEQTRLQPEILEAIEAPFLDETRYLGRLLTRLLPRTTALALQVRLRLMALLGRPPALELAARQLLAAARAITRQAITQALMEIRFPQGIRLKLWSDLDGSYPPLLQVITNGELRQLLEEIDPTPDSLRGSGAVDWTSLPERLHFIADLFRLYQLNQILFMAPFTPEQQDLIKAGELPKGPL